METYINCLWVQYLYLGAARQIDYIYLHIKKIVDVQEITPYIVMQKHDPKL